jgi:1-deoxy-D-xylulose-5-phosphate reductoisomerase
MRRLTLLGATGSIGASTLDIVARHPDRYRIHALTAHRNVAELVRLCMRFRPEVAVVADTAAVDDLRRSLDAAGLAQIRALAGAEALCAVAADQAVDTVVAAIVGAAGLPATLAAAESGKRILLANKEALVMAGPLFMSAVARGGAELLPVDSEHNALFQCLPRGFAVGALADLGIERLLLTASGGPFRERDPATFADITPDEACAHPNWDMGRKISVDSATMMNKGLELIEACWLFGVEPAAVEVVIHPQSIVHSLVRYRDGSVLAQLGNPDMRTPIAHALAYPERIEAGVRPLDLFELARLDFERPDPARFPCLALATEAMKAGGAVPAVLNAANEIAVAAFLAGRLGYDAIAAVIADTLAAVSTPAAVSLVELLDVDERARSEARRAAARRAAD